MNDLQTFLRSCKAKHILLTLDCCFAGRIFEDVGMTRGAPMGLTSPSRLILTSVGGNKVALDGPKGKMSPFAAAFIKALREGSKDENGKFLNLGAESLVVKIRTDLESQNVDQNPIMRKWGEGEGQFLFSVEKN